MNKTRQRRITRRQFMGEALAGAGAFAAAPAIVSGRNLNDKLNIAMIGAGGRGAANLAGVESENIVALCDVDARALDKPGAQYPQAKKYADFRKLFDRPKHFDAVVVSTCEHTHAFATMLALRHRQARLLREAADLQHLGGPADPRGRRETEGRDPDGQPEPRIGQLPPRHGADPERSDRPGPRSARLGQPRVGHPERGSGDAQSRTLSSSATARRRSNPVPNGLDWDLWLGPAPARPFNSVYVPGPKWYRWWDFGNGTMSDLGSHWNDLAFWALEIRAPLTVEAFADRPAHPEIAPATMRVDYEYGARGDMPPLKLTWHQGESRPKIWTDGGIPQWPDAQLFIGDKGMILSSGNKHVLLPEKDFADFVPPPQTIPNSPGHYAEWIEACKGGKPSLANFDYAGWTTEANHLGNVAYRVGKKLQWDAERMKATNAPEADQFIRREYRKGWRDILHF